MKRVLILGGTNFIGRNLVERLLETDAYEITLFNRQLTQADLFPSVNKIKGDRETNEVNQIEGKEWNYVIDLSCYYPDSLDRILKSVKNLDKYIFISTCSVYDNEHNHTLLRNEGSKILSCSTEQATDRSPETYGNKKAECERILKKSGLPYSILRPALVFGKCDPTDRLYYWLYQSKKNNVLLLPENGERIFSTTYVSDLVESIIQSLKSDGKSEVYNVITKPKTSIGQIIELAGQYLDRNSSTLNAPADFLNKNDISQWTDMPLWINGDHFTYNNQALKNDLGIAPTEFKVSIENTISYYEELNWPVPQYGISEERRMELIEKLRTTANKN